MYWGRSDKIKALFVLALALLTPLIAYSKTIKNSPEFVLAEYMKAKSSGNLKEIKSFFPAMSQKELEYLSKPESYQILERFEIGKDLKVVQGFVKKDIILKVKELRPNEIMFYTFRQNSGKWQLLGFEAEDAFWHHSF